MLCLDKKIVTLSINWRMHKHRNLIIFMNLVYRKSFNPFLFTIVYIFHKNHVFSQEHNKHSILYIDIFINITQKSKFLKYTND